MKRFFEIILINVIMLCIVMFVFISVLIHTGNVYLADLAAISTVAIPTLILLYLNNVGGSE